MYCLFMLFYVLFVCKCVLLPLVVNPIAVKYIISTCVIYSVEKHVLNGACYASNCCTILSVI